MLCQLDIPARHSHFSNVALNVLLAQHSQFLNVVLNVVPVRHSSSTLEKRMSCWMSNVDLCANFTIPWKWYFSLTSLFHKVSTLIFKYIWVFTRMMCEKIHNCIHTHIFIIIFPLNLDLSLNGTFYYALFISQSVYLKLQLYIPYHH